MHRMDHKEWLDQLIGSDSFRTAAAKIGVDQSTLSRQLTRRGTLSPENVIALARAYGRRAGDELVVTGYLTTEDIEGVGVDRALRAATNKQLLDEVEQRMDAGIGAVFGEPVGSVTPDRDELHLRAVADSSEREDGHGRDQSDWDA